jgi:hypothetical protein
MTMVEDQYNHNSNNVHEIFIANDLVCNDNGNEFLFMRISIE